MTRVPTAHGAQVPGPGNRTAGSFQRKLAVFDHLTVEW